MDSKARQSGFTIVELLVATAVLMLLMALLLSALNSSMTIWTRGASKIQSFQQARAAYEAMTRKISQATLNIYWDYDTDASGNPTGYKRQSELQFLSGPSANILPGAGNSRTHSVFLWPRSATQPPRPTCKASSMPADTTWTSAPTPPRLR
jgi:uncharacterized protein (TIGR02599 family)